MNTGKIVSGALAGLAMGAIAGILLAPEKGSTTRKQIMDKSGDYADKLKSKFTGFRDSVADRFEEAKNDAENLAKKGKEKYNDVKKEVKNTATNFKNDAAADINRATS